MDYGFSHHGKVFTPNGAEGIDAAENDSRNADIERAELARWDNQPERMLVYYSFPAERLPLFGRPRVYRENFNPLLHTFVNADKPGDSGIANVAIVTTWRSTKLGTIVDARVYRHNFGGRMVALTVKATNGCMYYGRASWDNGDCVWLRKTKAGRRNHG